MKYSLSIILLSLFFSCAKQITPPKGQSTFTEKLVKEMNGIYRAELMPVNPMIEGGLIASATVARERDEFIVDVYVTEATPDVFHPQNIHIGDRCPTHTDDLNNDGFIDIEEAFRVVGEVIIPIDEDISSQWMGLGTYPVTDSFGSYFWARATSFTKLLKDLYEEDINFDDDIIKLPHGEKLSLDGKVIMILGVNTAEVLPDTIQGRKRMTPNESLPIACGLFKEVKSGPGKIDQDDPITLEIDNPEDP